MLERDMDWTKWIGRRSTQRDLLTPATLARFRATIDSAERDDIAPQAIHWCLCLPDAPTAALGTDGHPRRTDDPDSFLPPIPLPRRMWAASDVRFHVPIRAGAAIDRQSAIAGIEEKRGSGGQLIFVEVMHDTHADGIHAVSERQTIVFREPAPVPSPDMQAPAPVGTPDLSGWSWQRTLIPSEPMLFRYSALTFNSHRIHYDRPYATGEEGYRGLVVHGPLTATLLLDLAQRELGSNALSHFRMRAQAPAFAGEPLHLVGRRAETGWELAAIGADGRTVMTASAN
ncbi:MAG: MaoC family dehydratase N-terminal domain-containing protein [Sphingopyxis sp.]|uniref:FAS1-like dehydratase domain-containing protein n=1 Tax=Sphingopyxis sp. TaxID=1908224 RepID=UPI002ABCD1E7|nr:MaoC family dehydratase N-terminal domain-containing protein [Sphingopyxis sp.]MDZ3833615.1 MaoC family dehydratase N-terminal domain-containing protein [Sphingopyxis sp.]